MALKFQDDYEDVCFKEVADLLHFYGLTDLSRSLVEKAFRNSYTVVFVKDGENGVTLQMGGFFVVGGQNDLHQFGGVQYLRDVGGGDTS